VKLEEKVRAEKEALHAHYEERIRALKEQHQCQLNELQEKLAFSEETTMATRTMLKDAIEYKAVLEEQIAYLTKKYEEAMAE